MSTIVISDLSILEELNNQEMNVFGAAVPAVSSSTSNSNKRDARAPVSASSTGNNRPANDDVWDGYSFDWVWMDNFGF